MIAAVVVAAGILGLRGETHEKIAEILAATIADPGNPKGVTPVDLPQNEPIEPKSPKLPPLFKRPPPPPSSPLPQTSTGNVNLGTLLVELSACGVWDECVINVCGGCGEDGVPRPIACKSEDGWIYADFDAGSQTVGFKANSMPPSGC